MSAADAEAVDTLNVDTSAALTILSALKSAGKLTEAQEKLWKNRYEELHESVMHSFARTNGLLAEAKQQRQELLTEQAQAEMVESHLLEIGADVSNFEEERDQAAKQLGDCLEHERVAQAEFEATKQQVLEKELEVREMKAENMAQVGPEMERVKGQTVELREESKRMDASRERELKREKEAQARLKRLTAQLEQLQQQLREQESELREAAAAPDREVRQATLTRHTLEAAQKDKEEVEAQLAAESAAVEEHASALETVRAELASATEEVDAVRAKTVAVEHKRETLQTQLAAEEMRESEMRQHAVRLTGDERALQGELKRHMAELQSAGKHFVLSKRQLKRAIKAYDASAAELPPYHAECKELERALQEHRAINAELVEEAKGAQRELRASEAVFHARHNVEEKQRQHSQREAAKIEDMEAKLAVWKVETAKMSQTITALTSQRNSKMREASSLGLKEEQVLQQARMKAHHVTDLKRRVGELNTRLTEFGALYEVVKNERNKYVKLIQASSQATAEMREKLKILNNEVDILSNETRAKEKALHVESVAHATANYQRDGLHAEANRQHTAYEQKQRVVESQIVEVEKLNAVISSMEKAMVALKGKYEAAVEARNFTGVQLIDRNDELCVLYEKYNVQQQTARRGNMALVEREDEERELVRQVRELERKVGVVLSGVPKVQRYGEQILELQQALEEERQVTESLCQDLESPSNLMRWRHLSGEDPTEPQLRDRLRVVTDRMDNVSEHLLEREMVLEEVGQLASALEQQAKKGRAEGADVVRQVSELQTRLRSTTRSMMATVSELSMYQATAMKLKEQQERMEQELSAAVERMSRMEPPTEEAEDEWFRMQQLYATRAEATRRRKEEEALRQELEQPTRTHAVPRPNAYVPTDALGVPKPYNFSQPFKPAEAGAQMRHFVKPAPRAIII